jgi:Protein of unknown function (DUF2778)
VADYSHEVGDPQVPRCGNLALSFNGYMLKLSGGQIDKSYGAISGVPGPKHLEQDRYRHMQNQADLGPIPEGKYWIRLDEIQSNTLGIRRNRGAWGNYWVTIHVFPGTKTFNRGGFFIHGGTTPGSIGCIDLTTEMDVFVKDLRQAADGKTNCYVPLTVKYR